MPTAPKRTRPAPKARKAPKKARKAVAKKPKRASATIRKGRNAITGEPIKYAKHLEAPRRLLNIRLSEEEIKALEEIAFGRGITTSETVRTALQESLNLPKPKLKPKVGRELISG